MFETFLLFLAFFLLLLAILTGRTGMYNCSKGYAESGICSLLLSAALFTASFYCAEHSSLVCFIG